MLTVDDDMFSRLCIDMFDFHCHLFSFPFGIIFTSPAVRSMTGDFLFPLAGTA